MNFTEKELLIWAIALGLALAFFAVYYKRRVIGTLVRALRNAEANSPETAKTLIELEQDHNVSAVETLKKSASLRRLITIQNDTEPENPPKKKDTVYIDENTRFYIAPDMITRSRAQYGDDAEPLWHVLLGCVGIIIIAVIATMIVQ